MEQLGAWERNISFPWNNNNINHHQQQQLEETFIFGSDNIFLNPLQDLPKPGSSPVQAAGSLSDQLPPAIDVASSFDSASQRWRQTLTHEGKNVIPLTSLDYTTSLDQEDDISLLFSNHKVIENHSDVVSSDGSVTKESDNESSLEKKPKRPRSDPGQPTSSTINFQQPTESDETDSEVVKQMKEMIYRAAAFRPVSFTDDDVAEKPRRRNVRISNDPQTVAARKRREKISERIRVLQKLVPGGDKMDTASMLDEAANYLRFLRSQVKVLEQFRQKVDYVGCGTTTNAYSTIHNVTLGVPFSMQAPPFLLPTHQQIYPTLPPA